MARFSEEQLIPLIAALYEAAAEPSLYPAFVEALCAQLDAGAIALNNMVMAEPGALVWHQSSWYNGAERGLALPGESFAVGAGAAASKAAQHEYLSHWAKHDRFSSAMFARASSRGLLAFDRQELTPDDDFERLPFYQEFARPHELFHIIGGAGAACDRSLTPAESRVAALLSEGHSPEDIAEKLHVSLGTVRNQLKQAFGKTGAHRQSDLVRLVLNLPSER